MPAQNIMSYVMDDTSLPDNRSLNYPAMILASHTRYPGCLSTPPEVLWGDALRSVWPVSCTMSPERNGSHPLHSRLVHGGAPCAAWSRTLIEYQDADETSLPSSEKAMVLTSAK
jgi:hypothetical protein